MKRNSLEICYDIVRASEGGAKKTHLVYRANLNFKMVEKYLTKLTEEELIEKNRDRFFLTEKGSEFIECYESLTPPLDGIIFDASG